MTSYYLPLQPDTFYHVYNRGNNGDTLFYQERNYRYFLQKFAEYICPYADVYAYALLPNHFHFLLRMKFSSEISTESLALLMGKKNLTDYSAIVSEEFRRLFLCYAKAIKVQEGRTGSLFEKNFKRKEVKTTAHLLWLVNYIHRNPETHGIAKDFRFYAHSSYQSLLSTNPTTLKRTEVLGLLGGKEEFVRFHLTNPVVNLPDELAME